MNIYFWRAVCAVVVLLSLGHANAIEKQQTEKQPNVLFIAVDDLRNDLGAFGVPHAKSPQIDAFAATARLFDRHYVQVPTCGASRCALMRGRYPTVASQVGNDGIKQTRQVRGIVRGYRTGHGKHLYRSCTVMRMALRENQESRLRSKRSMVRTIRIQTHGLQRKPFKR